ncbi:MAG: tetratricopeptide repeat protein [Thermodesulfobacteriota bacterium]
MQVKRKIIKKKLKKPDEFISFTEKSLTFILHHRRKFLSGAILIILFILAIYLFKSWERKKEEEANQKFYLVLEKYQTLTSPYREGNHQELKEVLKEFDEIQSNYSDTYPGRFSLLYKGDLYLRLSEYDEAIKAYQAFLKKGKKEKLYRFFALEGLGYAYEGKKEYEKALQVYQEILKLDEIPQWTNVYLNIGRCYEKMGKNKEALENYRTFLRLFPKSSLVNPLLSKISKLEKESTR